MCKHGAFLCLSVLVFARGGGDTLPTGRSMVRSLAHSTSTLFRSTAPNTISRREPMILTNTQRVIEVGEEVGDTLIGHGTEVLFELTAPADGELVVRVDWDPLQGRIELRLADTSFANYPDNVSPLIGRVRVLGSEQYLIRVEDGAPWDYDDLVLPFVLTTSIESAGGRSTPGGGCVTVQPQPDWICVAGGWVPPNHPLAGAPEAGPGGGSGTGAGTGGNEPNVSCSSPQPAFTWVCVNGGWLPPDHPLAAGAGAGGGGTSMNSPTTPPATSCTTSQPASTWICINGGWVPSDHPLARGG